MDSTLSESSDKNLLAQVSQHNVNLWRKTDNTTIISEGREDVFTASIILANRMNFIGGTTIANTDPTFTSELVYVANNTANDYLLASEQLVLFTQSKLVNVISANLSNLQVILAFEVIAVVAVCASLLYAARIIIVQYRTLFRALLKIEERQISDRLEQIQRMKMMLSEDIESKKFGLNVLETLKPSKRDFLNVKGKKTKNAGFHKREEMLVMSGVTIFLAKYIGVSLIVVQIVTGLLSVAMLEAISNFKSLQQVNTQLSATTTAQYQSSSLVGIFYMDILYYNDTTMLIRNNAISYELEKVMDTLVNVNNLLITSFSSDSGTDVADPIISEIFSSSPCSFINPTIKASCLTASGNQDVGLLSLNTAFYSVISQYKALFLSNPTYANALKFVNNYVGVMRPRADTLEYTYRFVNSHIISKFEETTSFFLQKTNLLHSGIVIAIFASTVFVLVVSITKIRFSDASKGKILKAVSCRILLENKAVGFYLAKHFLNKRDISSKLL